MSLVISPRNYYVAEPGCIILDCDYESQEYKMLGHYSNDANFMQFIREGKDVHKATASMLYNVPYEQVDKDMRQKGKTGNFATVYGIGNPSIANSMGYKIDEARLKNGTKYLYKVFQPWKIPPYCNDCTLEIALQAVEAHLGGNGTTEERAAIFDGVAYFFDPHVQEGLKAAADFKKKYFGQFPDIKTFIKDCSDAAAKRGYVKTWTGRRRHFKKPKEESYKAPNAVIQGGCGDIAKVKLWELVQFLRPFKTRIINTVHDSIMFNMPFDEVQLIPDIKRIMEDLPFRVPITVGVEWGFTWGEEKAFTTVEELRKELGVV